ncbi:anthranilate synthase component I family protein [Danxiaibacter flavus]|uniref:Anthranilate synthase component I family protein n=1 Tax=Danxiaibacter flavus TaxID=3049108 RepID=A0ABV3ZA32_9BACT|nr:anthranilate synthase component I family protein [Chitinophagaceae bacterium DXS]
MQRNTATYSISDNRLFKQQMLSWANQFNICCFLDNHEYSLPHTSTECLVAAGALSYIEANQNALLKLQAYQYHTKDWIFGHISYDVKNEIEQLTSGHPDHIQFPSVFFFQPETILQLNNGILTISSATLAPEKIMQEILKQVPLKETTQSAGIKIQSSISRNEYIDKIHLIQKKILQGYCYELNFCQQFFSEHAVIDPLATYHHLTSISPTPFATYYKLRDKYLLCASPERYIQKKEDIILSQPIKGTGKRDLSDPQKDACLKEQLRASSKDRNENVMIVDLVRNDLSKICKEASVTVEELFGIYTFPQVHQMISTIKGHLKQDVGFTDILRATFPMGSMTGAPKRKVMELIEEFEVSKRGIYSGAVGYITPENNFDFNVVIRSIIYNQLNKYLSYHVGGAITGNSIAESEYEECLLKASAIEQALHINR